MEEKRDSKSVCGQVRGGSRRSVDITDLEGETDKPVRQVLAIYYKEKEGN
jgi:hypothetical protein